MPVYELSRYIAESNFEGIKQLIDEGLFSANHVVYKIYYTYRYDMKWELLWEICLHYTDINIFKLVGCAIHCNNMLYCERFIDTSSEFLKKTLLDGAYVYALLLGREEISRCLLAKGAEAFSDAIDEVALASTRRQLEAYGGVSDYDADEEDISNFAEEVYHESESMHEVLIPQSEAIVN